jgi:hypothetical protein
MFHKDKRAQTLIIILLTMTILTPIITGMTANYTGNPGTPKLPSKQTKSQDSTQTTLLSKWNFTYSNYGFESSPAIADINGDGKLDVIIGNDYGIFEVNGSGSTVHTYYTSEDPSFSDSPVVADLNGTGKLDVLCLISGYLNCFNGSLDYTQLWETGNGFLQGTPAVGDLSGNGKLGIVIGDLEGNVTCFNSSGGQVWTYSPGGGTVSSSPTLADINGDGKLEVLVHMENSSGYDTLVCLNSTPDASGHVKPLWTFGMGKTSNTTESSPAVADLYNDGHMEIVVGSADGNIYCINSTGKVIWSFLTGGSIHSSPTIVDVDNDGKLEILIGSDDDNLYCLNTTGGLKWSYTTGGPIWSSPAVADVDGDRMLEVLFGSQDDNLYCLNRTGGLKWQYMTGGEIVSSPAVADIDGDGRQEIVFGSYAGMVSVNNTFYCLSVASDPVVPGVYPWPSVGYRGDIWHSGCYNYSLNDGLTANYKITAGTNPNSVRTDGAQLTDYQEFLVSGDPFDGIPPATISNLAVLNPRSSNATLTWTAPGDDGMGGNASGYLVKYSTSGPINSTNWNSATTFSQSWTPRKNGTKESYVVTGLTSYTHYWFAIEAYDKAFNYGAVSNSPGFWTLVTGWQSNPPINLIPGQGNNMTMPSGSFGHYGFTMITTNATNVVVISASSQPPGTGAPPSGTLSFLYLYINGSQMSGTTGAAIYIYFNRTLVRSDGINELSLQLNRWNTSTSKWDAIPTTVTLLNDTTGVLTARLNHFSYFAVLGAPSSGTSPMSIPIIVVAMIAVLVVVASVVVLRKRRSAELVKTSGKAKSKS